MKLTGTICDGCGRQVGEETPRGWIRNEIWVLGPGTEQRNTLDFDSTACAVRYWSQKLDEEEGGGN